jgi:hypothetical protein
MSQGASTFSRRKLFLWSSLPGRAALQKRIMALLRKIEHCVNGVQPVSNDLAIRNMTQQKTRCIDSVLHYE